MNPTKQNPFSIYDFLGYFVPGAFAIYIYFVIRALKVASPETDKIKVVLNELAELKPEYIIPFLIIAYIFGHLLSYVSSITIEQYANWKYNYPSKYLLGIDMENTGYWKGVKKFHSIFWRIILYLGLAPIVFLDYVLGFLFGFKNFYYKGMDDNLRKLIKIKTGSLLVKLGMNSDNGFEKGFAKYSDFFRIIHHYVYENSTNHQSKMVNYVALYGFLRTLCVTINLLFYYLIIHYTFYKGYSWPKFWLVLSTGIVSYIFFMAFMKFYRRYTLEGLMLVAVDKELGTL